MKRFYHLLLLLVLVIANKATYGQVVKSSVTDGFQYEGCGCVSSVILRIFDGLNTNGNTGIWGGKEVVQISGVGRHKYNEGAITVANLNDTDGNGSADKDDLNVQGSSSGVAEMDLMKLIIEPVGEMIPNCKVKLSLLGKIKLFSNYDKGNEITNNEFDITDASGNQISHTLYIEAYDVSSSMRDIEIKAEIDGVVHDKVRATGIWVAPIANGNNGKTTIRAATPSTITLGLDEPCVESVINNSFVSIDGSFYGLGTNSRYLEPPFSAVCGLPPWTSNTCNSNDPIYQNIDGSYGGRILVGFEIFPSGLKNELAVFNVNFDVTRRIKNTDFRINYGSIGWAQISSIPFPQMHDLSNDDNDSADEDNDPSSNSMLFSFDNPDNVHYLNSYIGSPNSFRKRDLDFQEYVRVSFDTQISPHLTATGNGLFGSRTSDFVPWNINYILKSARISGGEGINVCHQYLSDFSEPVSFSEPRRLSFNGTSKGIFNVSLLPLAYTCRYLFQYKTSNDSWIVMRNNSMVGTFFPQPGANPKIWLINDVGRANVVLQEVVGFPFVNNEHYSFNVLKEAPFYDFK
jgi:hypothetical protein